jgi:CspA family cold shock protein
MTETIFKGKVKWWSDSKGFGFIDGNSILPDIFVHYTAIVDDGFKTLSEGQEVEFELTDGPKGTKGPTAKNVKPNREIRHD